MDSKVPNEEFNSALWKRFNNGKIRNVYPFIKYNDIIEKIKAMEQNPPCNTPGEYYLLRKFIVVNVNGKERLSCKPENCVLSENSQNRSTATKFYVALEEIYTFLDEAHKWVKHGCRDKLLRRVQSQGIVNITRETVELFLSFCKLCRPRSRNTIKQLLKSDLKSASKTQLEVSHSPISDINSNPDTPYSRPVSVNLDINTPNSSPHTVCTFTRGFVDLIDFTYVPDGDYRLVFLYMDVQTCFSVLHPVRCKCIFEIVSHLLSIFTLFGPPQVLHSNLESNFLHSVINDLKCSLPEIVLVAGSTSYSEVQEVAQNCIAEVENMLKEWMRKNNSGHWSHGLKLVQLKKNTRTPGNSSKSPFECFFGRTINSNCTVDPSLLKNAMKEEDLLRIINEHASSETPSYEQLQVSVDPDICSLVQNNVQNHLSRTTSIKTDILSDNDTQEMNGSEFSDSSNDRCSSPSGQLEIVIKEEVPDDS
ncbi:hypothetical protein JTE90_016911 [Oedothorax gibbosus]|uniref:Integrase catalytic domain-containing protein n=1 Tax=Oedothorax gibbosus TaxID=931172 RepID=A0AAV6UV16_9ARAC|nr:hypothetical protein JTE90_016911 [Oedothorax gibbosus]